MGDPSTAEPIGRSKVKARGDMEWSLPRLPRPSVAEGVEDAGSAVIHAGGPTRMEERALSDSYERPTDPR